MSKLKDKLGKEKYEKFIELLKDTEIKESDVDLLEGYVPRMRLNEALDKVKATEEKAKQYETQIKETKTLLEESEKFKEESETFKQKYTDLENKHKSDIEGKDKEIANVLKRSLVKEKLISEGAKHPDLLLREINLDEVNIKDNKLFGFDDTFKSINETYKDLFTKTENSQDINTGTGGSGGEGGEDDFSYLDNIKS